VRRSVLVLAVIAASIGVAVPRGAAAASHLRLLASPCLPRRDAAASDGFGQVWVNQDSGDMWGCAYGNHRVRHLENLGAAPILYFGDIVMAGHFVAAESGAGDPDSGYAWDSICIFNVLDGHTLACFGDANGANGAGGGGVGSMVVKPDGSAAWIAEPPGDAPNQVPYSGNEVWAYDADGYRLVASGADIAPASLALGRNRIYWIQGGAAESAPLA